jgi:hypothetical protein
MKIDTFMRVISDLTGTEVKGVGDSDRECLEKLLSKNDDIIDCSQFNELLLLVNKDRVRQPFFRHFFGDSCKISDIQKGAQLFRKTAMLRYGNFVFAYRTLSKIRDHQAFLDELAEWSAKSDDETTRLLERKPKLLEIDTIDRESTVLLGYLSADEMAKDKTRCDLLSQIVEELGQSSIKRLNASIGRYAKPEHKIDLEKLVARYIGQNPDANLARFKDFLRRSLGQIDKTASRIKNAQRKGQRNQDVYLTWDHMDVYFATSMRKPWEFKELYDFIQRLMNASEILELHLRYFDPTQSYTGNRINKGLLETLMLKRARCTVYSVQDTDTLGKDSELAATLAQGKSVIAYLPEVNLEKRARELAYEDPQTIIDRLKFAAFADGSFDEQVDAGDSDFIRRFDDLEEFCKRRIWHSVSDVQAVKSLRNRCDKEILRLCRIVAAAEKRICDGRARIFKTIHPLALQVNLATGVANGVLLVRSVEQAARLLRCVVTRSMEFDLEEDAELWYLRERISGCVYRVVTKDRKLGNCFWNFYLNSSCIVEEGNCVCVKIDTAPHREPR